MLEKKIKIFIFASGHNLGSTCVTPKNHFLTLRKPKNISESNNISKVNATDTPLPAKFEKNKEGGGYLQLI